MAEEMNRTIYGDNNSSIPPKKKIADTILSTVYTSQERVRQTEVQSSLDSEDVVNNSIRWDPHQLPLCVPGLGLGQCPRGVSELCFGENPLLLSEGDGRGEADSICALVVGVFPNEQM